MNGQVLGIYGDMFTKSHNQFDSSLSAELRDKGEALQYILYSDLRPRSKRKSKVKQEICSRSKDKLRL